MGTKIPLPNIPDSNTAPEGIYRLVVDALEEGTTRVETGSKLMVVMDCSVVEPAEYSDVTIREWFTIGSEKDPNAMDPGGDAWRSIGARAFKQFLIGCGYPLAELDLDDVIQQVPGVQFVAKVNLSPAKGDFPERNRLAKFFPPGAQTVEAAAPRPQQTNHRAPVAPQQAAARPGPRAAAAPAGQPAGRPGPARPAPRQSVTAPAEAGPEEAVAEPRATPAATPTQRAHRAPAKTRAGTGASTVVVDYGSGHAESRLGETPKSATSAVVCAICLDVVPRAEFQAHVKAHGDAA